MAITRAEFVRVARVGFGDAALRIGDERLDGHCDGVDWSVQLEQRPDRRLAQLTLPVLDVTLDCAADDDERIERFVERLLRVFQRSGG